MKLLFAIRSHVLCLELGNQNSNWPHTVINVCCRSRRRPKVPNLPGQLHIPAPQHEAPMSPHQTHLLLNRKPTGARCPWGGGRSPSGRKCSGRTRSKSSAGASLHSVNKCEKLDGMGIHSPRKHTLRKLTTGSGLSKQNRYQ